MEIEKIECIWWDGYHNAFTDIIEFKGNYYCTFRHGTQHSLQGKGEIYILKSSNLKNWELIRTFSPLKDSRDPKFFIFKENLGVLFFTYPDINTTTKKDAYISYTDDGENFSSLIKISQDNLCFWRIRNYKEKIYATAYSSGENKDDWGSYLFVSEDGENFEKISTIVKGEYANETDLLFEENKCYAIVRREKMQTPVLSISEYPFEKWENYPLNEIVQGPHIFKYRGKIYVVGRIFKNERPETGILNLDVGRKKLEFEIILPSGGDTSYCGSIVKIDKIYLTYYSQHETWKKESKVGENAAGIYLAVLK